MMIVVLMLEYILICLIYLDCILIPQDTWTDLTYVISLKMH